MASNITPGVQQYCQVTNPTGLAGSKSQDVCAPVEAGRASEKSAYTTTVSSGNPLAASAVVKQVNVQKSE